MVCLELDSNFFSSHLNKPVKVHNEKTTKKQCTIQIFSYTILDNSMQKQGSISEDKVKELNQYI